MRNCPYVELSEFENQKNSLYFQNISRLFYVLWSEIHVLFSGHGSYLKTKLQKVWYSAVDWIVKKQWNFLKLELISVHFHRLSHYHLYPEGGGGGRLIESDICFNGLTGRLDHFKTKTTLSFFRFDTARPTLNQVLVQL
jgi:hypothetical protein